MASVQRRLYRLRDLADDMGAVTASETAPDGSVSVTVDGNGALVDLRFSQAISKMSPTDFEKALIDTAHAAAARAFAARGDLINAFNDEIRE
ncbi:YbaB/EbfC family nucleoid-associated protein [Nocardia panacis]|nr:YbaB/EbfC family nucleoid-associated protein [Nocardia panacis]